LKYRGRIVDPISLWSNYVDFPPNWTPSAEDEFAPLVRCPNPDHVTTKRHFQVNLKQPLVHCFAHCGISGTFENAIIKIEGGSHRQARRAILKHSRIGGEIVRKKKRVGDRPEGVDLDYARYLPQAAVEYLKQRGISESSCAKWELGWNPDELRIVIPVHDARGRLRLLVRRTIKPNVEPRYLYTEGVERNRLLFGTGHIDLGMVRSVGIILVEGTFDCIRLHQHGFTNTVAILGSKLSRFQAKQIANMRPLKVYTMFDADAAGVGATISTHYQLPNQRVHVCRYPAGKTDPARLNQREAEKSVSRAITFSQFSRMTRMPIKRKDFQVG
jgi:DNA primase